MGKGHGSKSDAMRQKFVEVMANPENKTNAERAEAVGISETTLYEWLKDAEIKRQIELLIDAHTDTEMAAIWDALIKKCLQGDVSAIKLFMELKDKYTSRTEQNGEININIKIDN